ncbi:TAXI family TRAP transporter solute-binding subunit [Yoonia sp.]|uniref:TAXI family TRAP transporter solute-binding subunit n=1 Tax=Yoonia sp. TaxID=2212373 RepID=UPI004047FB0A
MINYKKAAQHLKLTQASHVAICTALMFASTPAMAQSFLNVGTSSSASSQYTYWVSVGQSIEAGTGGMIIPTIMETGASVDNLRRMSRGEIELGLATAEAAGQAYRGIGAFDGESEMSDLRMLWCYAALPNIYVTRTDAGIDNLSDLEGKAYNVGIPGSSTEAQTRTVFETLGITPDIQTSATADAVDSLRDGQIVGFTKAASSANVADASFMEVNTTLDVKIVGMDAEQIAAVTEKYPYYSSIEVPSGTYPGQDAPITVLAVAACGVATTESLSDEQAYDIMKAVFENKSIQEDAYPAAKAVDFGRLTTDLATIPLHPGALNYLTEIGVDVPQDLKAE